MDGLDIYQAIEAALEAQMDAVEDFKRTGIDRAQKEREYRKALCRKELELRADGFPVTITSDVAKGCDEVEALRFDRDCADVLFEAAKHSIFTGNVQLRVLESMLKQEYNARG